MTEISPDELLTIEEVAATLKVNQQTVRNWGDRGELPIVRVGARRIRVRRGDLEAFIGHRAAIAAAPKRRATNAKRIADLEERVAALERRLANEAAETTDPA